MDWKRILGFSAAAAGAVAVLYYLLREEPEPTLLSRGGAEDTKKQSVDEVTVEEIREIIAFIVESQEKMRSHMRALTKELLQKPDMSFDQAYNKVREVQPSDPLESRGLSMVDFDQLLNKFQSDPQVRNGIARIMGVPPDMPATGEQVQVPATKTVEVHAFMLQELEKLLQSFQKLQNKEQYDVKTVTLAAQAIVGAKVEEKYSLTSEDIERAVVTHHSVLATDQEFANINMKMQHTMAQLMGAQA